MKNIMEKKHTWVQRVFGKKQPPVRPLDTISAPPLPCVSAQEAEDPPYSLSHLHLPRVGISFEEAIENQKREVFDIESGTGTVEVFLSYQEQAVKQAVNSPVVQSINGRGSVVLRLDDLSPSERPRMQEAVKQSRIFLVPVLAECPPFPVLGLRFFIYDDLTNPYKVEGPRGIHHADIQDFLQAVLTDGGGDAHFYMGLNAGWLGSGEFSLRMPPFSGSGYPYRTQPADLEQFWQVLVWTSEYLNSIPMASRDFKAAVQFYLEHTTL